MKGEGEEQSSADVDEMDKARGLSETAEYLLSTTWASVGASAQGLGVRAGWIAVGEESGSAMI